MPTPPTRVILSVPFEEKDQAKALGARWDPQQKHWWISSKVDTIPFARWLQLVDRQEPLYRDLSALDPDELEEYESAGLVEVFFVPWTCWKCKQKTLAFHGAVGRSICVTHLLYQATVIEELDKLRKGFGLDPFGCVKPRFSRTVGASYASQGCRNCDALIGENPLWEYFSEFFSTTDLRTYPYRGSLNWSLFRGARD
jgi:hypothetical protein